LRGTGERTAAAARRTPVRAVRTAAALPVPAFALALRFARVEGVGVGDLRATV